MESNEMPLTHTATPEHRQPVNPVANKAQPRHKGQTTSRRDLQGRMPEVEDHRKINALQMQPSLLSLTYISTLISAMLSPVKEIKSKPH